MPQFTQTSQNAPGYSADMLVGDGHYIADRNIDASQTLVAGDIVVRDTTSGNWRINDGWTTDNPDTDSIGVILEDVTTGVGEVTGMPVLVSGGILASTVNGLPANEGAGSNLGLLILE